MSERKISQTFQSDAEDIYHSDKRDRVHTGAEKGMNTK